MGCHHPKSFDYELWLSDLRGFDLESYDDSKSEAHTKENLVRLVVTTLSTLIQRNDIARPNFKQVSGALPKFMEQVDKVASRWNEERERGERNRPTGLLREGASTLGQPAQ